MNRIDLDFGGSAAETWSERAESFAQKVLAAIGRDGWDLSILFCDKETMQDLNKRYRGKDETTDVLSFELGEKFFDEEAGERYLSGDIAISVRDCAENAEYYKISVDEELRRLIIHGILHLDGQDHKTNESSEKMLVNQEKILAELSGERILL